MDALFRPVCAPSTLQHGYQRGVANLEQQSPLYYDDEQACTESSSEPEDDEHGSTSDSTSSSEEGEATEPATPLVYGYARCPPSSEAQQVDPAMLSNWTFLPDRTSEIRTPRGSDTASMTSSKQSLASRNNSTIGHGIIDSLLSPTVKNGKYVQVRKRPALSSTPSDSRSKSEPSVPTARKQRYSPSSLIAMTIRQRPKKNKDESESPKQQTPSRASRKVQSPKSVKPDPIPVQTVSCISCLEDIPVKKAAHLKCDHDMCRSCLARLFELSTTDPSLMPPRCCDDNEIELRHVNFLNREFKVLWNRKNAEYLTKHRLYCPKKGCGIWIKPKHIKADRATGRKMGTCPKCETKVCKKCHMKWHTTRDCENDKDTKQVLDMAKERAGWQRCYRCKAVVELDSGCNHMTCRCGAQFCMLCGRKWRDTMCQVECPLFSIPPETDHILPVIEDDDDLWYVPRRPRRGRGQDNLQDRGMGHALRALEEEFGIQRPQQGQAQRRQEARINEDDIDEQLARQLQEAEFGPVGRRN